MKLLERGQAPQKLLRLRPLAGSVQRIGVRSESTATLRNAGSNQPLPATPGVQMVLAAEVHRASPEGEILFRFTLEQVDLLVQAGMPVRAVEALREELAPLPGLSGEGRVSANGRSNGFALTLPPGMPEPLRAQLQQMSATLSGLGTLLPSEPVGQGARWEEDGFGSGPLSGARTSFALKRLDDSGLGLRIELDGPAKPQPVPPELRAQEGATSLHTEVRGQGGCLLSLDRLWPTRFELDVDSHAALRVEGEASARRLDGFTHLRMRLKELSFSSPVARGIAIPRSF